MSMPIPFAPGLYAGGQPSPDDLAGFATQGVRTVINLRAPGEPVEYDERCEAERLGLRYVSLPISGPEDVTVDNVDRFSRMLEEARRHGGTLVHCASSNRVGAMVALDLGITKGSSCNTALAMGRAAGLATLEPHVESLLNLHSAAD